MTRFLTPLIPVLYSRPFSYWHFLTSFFFWCFFIIPSISEEPVIDFAVFDAYVEKSVNEWKIPGIAIAIVKNGQIIHLKTHGMSRIKTKKPMTPKTIFPLASLTKGFTAALIGRLVDQGKIRWEDKVKQYMPDFKVADEKASQAFTVEDLFSHHSGLPGFAGDTLVETGWKAEEIYQVMHKIPLKSPFQSTYEYQNIFPGIAGWIASKIEKKPLSEVYETLLFIPLGLENTSIGQGGLTGGESFLKRMMKNMNTYFFDDRVTQYCHQNTGVLEILGGNKGLYCFEASRGINASVTDMAKWMIAQLEEGNSLFSPQNTQRMRTPHVTIGSPKGGRLFPKERVKNVAYGLGWFIHDYDRLKVIGHMGGMTGVRSLIALCPEEKLGIVILVNSGGLRDNLLPEALRSKFFDLYLRLPDQIDWSQTLWQDIKLTQEKLKEQRGQNRLQNPKNPRNLEMYIGDYENDLYGVIKLTLENKKLCMTYRHLKVDLTHWNGDDFTFIPHEFSPAYSGNETGMISFYLMGSLKNKPDALGINLLHEGSNSFFYRKP